MPWLTYQRKSPESPPLAATENQLSAIPLQAPELEQVTQAVIVAMRRGRGGGREECRRK
jgi:hypothetical protein